MLEQWRGTIIAFLNLSGERNNHSSLAKLSSASEIKILAIDNHASHNQNFCGLEDYVLLYPDGKEVVKLPETPTGTGEKKGK